MLRTHTPLRWARSDPWFAATCAVLLTLVAWTCAPLATGALAPVSSSQRIELTVPVSAMVTPGWSQGDTSVRLADLSSPGQVRDTTSAGWKMSSNWSTGYEVRVRSTTSPALRGQNAVDGAGASDSFLDFTKESCPCPWNADGFKRGVFGYSVSVATTSGAAPIGAEQWGTSSAREYRGFSRTSYRAYSTAGSPSEHAITMHLRSEIPQGAVQREGSYRGTMVLSVHPLL